jgi:hypothetical protein
VNPDSFIKFFLWKNLITECSFCQFNLDSKNKEIIERMIYGSNDNCYICGKKGHFANDCNLNINRKKSCDSLKKHNKCYRCGRGGYYSSNCYASKHIDGSFINDYESVEDSDEDSLEESDEEIDEEIDEEELFESVKNIIEDVGKLFNKTSNKKSYSNYKKNNHKTNKCYRCGRGGHYSSNCYASKHIKGYYLN